MIDLTKVPSALHAPAQRYWEQFEANRERLGLPALLDILGEHLQPEEFQQQLTVAFSASEYIAKTSASHPDYLIDIIKKQRVI